MKSLTQKMISILLITPAIVVISSCSNQQEETISNGKFHSDTVLIQAMQFSPAELKVSEGDTITWINKDIVDHNVKDTVNNLFYSDTLKNGQAFRWVVKGGCTYICTIHPTMTGKVLMAD